MFELNFELIVGDDQDANAKSLCKQADITNTAGGKPVPPPWKILVEGQQPQADNNITKCISIR